MNLDEKRLKRQQVYDGHIIEVYLDDVQMPDGQVVKREIVEHIGGVAIALEDNEGKFFLVKQYRYGQSREMIEFPAGKRELGEEPITTATREIIEETGYEGKDFVYLGKSIPTPAYVSEQIDMYYARIGEYKGQHLDDDEFVEVYRLTLDEIIDKIMNKEIDDSKTICMAFMIKEMKSRNK